MVRKRNYRIAKLAITLGHHQHLLRIRAVRCLRNGIERESNTISPHPPAALIERNTIYPAREISVRSIRRDRLVHPDKRLLNGIFSLGPVGQKPERESKQPLLISGDYLVECGPVASSASRSQPVFRIFGDTGPSQLQSHGRSSPPPHAAERMMSQRMLGQLCPSGSTSIGRRLISRCSVSPLCHAIGCSY